MMAPMRPSADRVDKLTYSVSDLLQQVALMQEELRAGLLGTDGEQASLRQRVWALEEAAQRAAERQAGLEARISNLEHEQQSVSLSITKSFQSLSDRIVVFADELASWPPAAEVRSAFDRLNQASMRVDERIAILEFDREAACQAAQAQAEQARGLRDALERCQAGSVALRTELQQALQGQAQECAELAGGMRAMLAEASSREAACEEGLEVLRAALEQSVGDVRGRACKAEEALHGLSEQTGKIENALRQCRADLNSTLTLSCKHGRETARDISHVRSKSQSCQRHIDELKRNLDKASQQGHQCQRDVQDIQALLHFRGELSSPPCSDPRHWNEGQLCLWLADHGLPGEVAQAFEAHLVNGLVGKDLSEEDLNTMGITDRLLQRRTLCELRNLFRLPAPGDTGGTKPAQICHDLGPGQTSALPARTGIRPQSARPLGGRSPPSPGAPSATRHGARAPPGAGRQRHAQEAASIALASGFRSTPFKPVLPRAAPQAPSPPRTERRAAPHGAAAGPPSPGAAPAGPAEEARGEEEPGRPLGAGGAAGEPREARGEALEGLEQLAWRCERLGDAALLSTSVVEDSCGCSEQALQADRAC